MVSTIILAAGTGSRCNLGYNKLLYKINGKMLIEYTLDNFKNGEIVLVVSENDYDTFNCYFKDIKIVIGGKTRQESVINGLNACSYNDVLIHDGARMFITEEVVKRVLEALKANVAVVPCVKVKDSIKNGEGKNINRDNLYIAQTPQGIKKDLYLNVVNENCSDDVTVLEKAGYDVAIVEGNYNNIKVTTIEDIEYAEFKIGGNNDLS